MRHPKTPHLFALSFDGHSPVAVIRAMSAAEARNYALSERFIVIEKLSPSRAFHIGRHEPVQFMNAKPEYAHAELDDAPEQGDLLDTPLPGDAAAAATDGPSHDEG